MKTAIALKMRLTGKILVMIPTYQVSMHLFAQGVEWGHRKLSFPVNPCILYLSLHRVWEFTIRVRYLFRQY